MQFYPTHRTIGKTYSRVTYQLTLAPMAVRFSQITQDANASTGGDNFHFGDLADYLKGHPKQSYTKVLRKKTVTATGNRLDHFSA